MRFCACVCASMWMCACWSLHVCVLAIMYVCARTPALYLRVYLRAHLNTCAHLLPWAKKKRSLLLMHKIIILWYRGIRVLHSAAEPRANESCDCRNFTHQCIVVKSDCRFFKIRWCIPAMVFFFFFFLSMVVLHNYLFTRVSRRAWVSCVHLLHGSTDDRGVQHLHHRLNEQVNF